jgi:hypothetical protein
VFWVDEANQVVRFEVRNENGGVEKATARLSDLALAEITGELPLQAPRQTHPIRTLALRALDLWDPQGFSGR